MKPWTEEQARAAEQFEMKLAAIRIHIEAIGGKIGKNLIDPFNTVLDVVTSVYGVLKKIEGLNPMPEWVKNLPDISNLASMVAATIKGATEAKAILAKSLPKVQGDEPPESAVFNKL